MTSSLHNHRILLIISGGIAAYKCLDLIRRLRELGARVIPVLTQSAAQFVTPLSVSSLAEAPVYTDLWALTDEQKMGHIRLSREADLVLVAPATANIIAKMAQGLADDLASTLLLATDKTVMVAPSMNVKMWEHPATQANAAMIVSRGVKMVGPDVGAMACGEEGAGRMADIDHIISSLQQHFSQPGQLSGKRVIVTSGPTLEPIDAVRYISNRSSGKQGHALAVEFAAKGAETILISGPTHLPDPKGIQTIHVQTAEQMLAACEASLPADVAVCAAAVGDWKAENFTQGKIKKIGANGVSLALIQNPDILATLSQQGNRRPTLVIGFAAETDNIIENAKAKLLRKGCDWLVANDVSSGQAFDKDDNSVTLIRRDETGSLLTEAWPKESKINIARHIVDKVISHFAEK